MTNNNEIIIYHDTSLKRIFGKNIKTLDLNSNMIKEHNINTLKNLIDINISHLKMINIEFKYNGCDIPKFCEKSIDIISKITHPNIVLTSMNKEILNYLIKIKVNYYLGIILTKNDKDINNMKIMENMKYIIINKENCIDIFKNNILNKKIMCYTFYNNNINEENKIIDFIKKNNYDLIIITDNLKKVCDSIS